MKVNHLKLWISLFAIVAVSFGINSCAGDEETTEEPVAVEQGDEGNTWEENWNENGDQGEAAAENNLVDETGEELPAQEAPVGEPEDYATVANADDPELSPAEPIDEEAETVAAQDEMIEEAVEPMEPVGEAPSEPYAEEQPEAVDLEAVSQEGAEPIAPAADPVPVPEPAAPAAPAYVEEPASPSFDNMHKYIVQPGETLGGIAEKIYGSTGKWKHLASVNQLSNPNVLHPGDVIHYEKTSSTSNFAASYDNSSRQSVTVKPGDTLSGIATDELGSASYWRYIWRFNQATVSNPNHIQVGQVLSYVVPEPQVSEPIATAPENVDTIGEGEDETY